MASFSDDFNRSDSTNLGAGWVEVSGDWSIVSNQLSPGAAGGTIILRAAGAMASNDHYAQATIAATAVASQGVWCRGNSNISQGYLWRNNGTSWDLFSVVGGSFTVIGTYTAAAAPGDVAKIQAVGTTITGFVNGVQRVSVTDTFVATGTSVGIRSDSAGAIRFDDFSAADVTAGTTLALTLAAATETAQPLTGTKTVALSTATAIEAAQPLSGGKTATLTPAAATEAAQSLLGAKAATLAVATATEAAQPLAGTKTAAVGTAGAVESAQPLTGSKAAALGTALEVTAVQALARAKTAPLPVAAQTETAQSLMGAPSASLNPAASVETALPLAGAKSAILGVAMETSAARPLAAAGGFDPDVTITVGAPYSPWMAGPPHGDLWPTSTPQTDDWEVGAPW